MKVEPKRDRWGRYLLPDPDTGKERAWTRATTISGILSDHYNIEIWAQRMVALGFVKRPELFVEMVRTQETDKKEQKRIVGEAKEAGGANVASELGTAIHEACEARDRGEPFDARFELEVTTYRVKMKELELDILPGWIERIVIVPSLGVAGTLDRMVTRRGWQLPRMADLKTGATVHFSELEHTIQQALYANATHYWDSETEELVEVPPIDKDSALIIHLPAGQGRCEVHDIDIAAGWEAAQIAAQVKDWRGRKGLSAPFQPIEPLRLVP